MMRSWWKRKKEKKWDPGGRSTCANRERILEKAGQEPSVWEKKLRRRGWVHYLAYHFIALWSHSIESRVTQRNTGRRRRRWRRRRAEKVRSEAKRKEYSNTLAGFITLASIPLAASTATSDSSWSGASALPCTSVTLTRTLTLYLSSSLLLPHFVALHFPPHPICFLIFSYKLLSTLNPYNIMMTFYV